VGFFNNCTRNIYFFENLEIRTNMLENFLIKYVGHTLAMPVCVLALMAVFFLIIKKLK